MVISNYFSTHANKTRPVTIYATSLAISSIQFTIYILKNHDIYIYIYTAPGVSSIFVIWITSLFFPFMVLILYNSSKKVKSFEKYFFLQKITVTIHGTSIFDLKNLILYCFEIPRKRPNERKRVRIGAIYFRSNNKKF